jgi:hypothetical protein
MALELIDDGPRLPGQDAEEPLRPRQRLTGQRELLHDHQPQLVGQLVERVLLLQSPTPDADEVDSRRLELAQEQLVALPGDAARAGVQRHPVDAFEKDRAVVDQQLQRDLFDPLPRAGHAVQGAQADQALIGAGLASRHPQRHAGGRPQAVGPPERGRRHFHWHGHTAGVHQRQDAADPRQLDIAHGRDFQRVDAVDVGFLAQQIHLCARFADVVTGNAYRRAGGAVDARRTSSVERGGAGRAFRGAPPSAVST